MSLNLPLSQIFLHHVFFTNFNRSHSSMTLFLFLIWSFIWFWITPDLEFYVHVPSVFVDLVFIFNQISKLCFYSLSLYKFIYMTCREIARFSVDLTFCTSFIRTLTSWAKLYIMIILLGSSKLTQTFCLHCMGNNATFTIVESSMFHV